MGLMPMAEALPIFFDFPFSKNNCNSHKKITTSFTQLPEPTSNFRNNSKIIMISDCSTSSCSSEGADALIESIRAMRHRENAYSTGDYLSKTSSMSCVEPVDEGCRSTMCQWSIQVVDHCKLNRETVAIATNLLDRFLETSPWALADRSAFQLAAITGLYTCVKIHEPQAIALETMANLSRNVYTSGQISSMERVMLENVKWLVNQPSAFAFARDFCEFLAVVDERYSDETLLDLVKLEIESSLINYELSMIPPSVVAFAAVMNAVEGMDLSSPAEQKEMESFLISAAQIGSEYPNMEDIQIQLYEGLLGTASQKAFGGHSRSQIVRPASPRSVSAVVARAAR